MSSKEKDFFKKLLKLLVLALEQGRAFSVVCLKILRKLARSGVTGGLQEYHSFSINIFMSIVPSLLLICAFSIVPYIYKWFSFRILQLAIGQGSTFMTTFEFCFEIFQSFLKCLYFVIKLLFIAEIDSFNQINILFVCIYELLEIKYLPLYSNILCKIYFGGSTKRSSQLASCINFAT